MIALLKKHSVLAGNIGLVLVMLLGLAYLTFGSLGWRPLAKTYGLTVELPNSGGIQTTSDVYLRGARIGTVDSIQVHPDHVAAKVTIEDGHKINRNSIVRASGLSAAGEQFLDFRPTTSDGPYFRNGDVVPKSQASVAIPFPKMLETTLKVVDQIDPAKLSRTIEQLDIALGRGHDGNDLRVLLDSAGTVFADLYKVLPQTQNLINNAGAILNTSSGIQPDLQRLVGGGSAVINAAMAADKELRTLLGNGATQVTSLTGSLNEIRDPITDVLKQFREIARQGSLRAPAIAALLPSIRDASSKSLSMFHNGAWWAMGSVYPRPSCNYPVMPTRPTRIQELTIPLNLYCVTEDPNQQIRGAANAPRPPGDDTAGPPPNFDPNARTVPLDR
ncbi:MAG TPA: MCE family protein [Gordonia sp. (in: high G+C Gram-positive bacteria)]|nr:MULTISPECIES: MCE family protein [unclassified Gordonia (in: high G+C Gram-positive bacteria)]RUP37478.1 MAG: MCE family protein [Gordonia sp. (in: high G+C Gram-positive bacteria)]HNP58179.1 MCE family protein [Gordonia sp. (in: high G+C Gram-positive bacteria)]HRC51766.1 MCE family protein [Gordonia sp. (in: high G+C Gram-positive bacteria)]